MKMKLFLTLLLLPLMTFAQPAEEFFLSGNEYYQQKKWKESVEAYEAAIGQGMESSELYYNLGNAYYKLKNLPAAILNYERAHLLKPGDEDILYNLKLANEKIADKVAPESKTFPERIWQRLLFLFNTNGWALLAAVLIWIAFGTATVFLFTRNSVTKKITFFSTLITVALAVTSLLMAYESFQYSRSTDTAIVFATNTYIKSEPDASSTDLFILHEGAKVRVINESNGWKKIRFGSNKIGWIRVEDIQMI